MPRLTAELISDSPQFTNPVRDWELDLRGNKIAVIENLGATLDQFDTIDFSDNEIRKLDGFPLLQRLKNILCSNNRVCRLAEDLDNSLPNLESITLTNNNIEELTDLEPLGSINTLTYLSLLRNPVIHKPGYRYYIINLLPNLRVLDFKRIRLKEKEKAKELFGNQQEKQIKSKTFTPGKSKPHPVAQPPAHSGPSPAEIAKIREAIAAARSLEEVQHLEAMLKAGQLPAAQIIGGGVATGHRVQNGQVVEEDMED